MPTDYLKQIHDEQGIPMETLEEYWEKAKAIAKKNGKEGQEFWKYTSGIFQRMAQVSTSKEMPDWWTKMSPHQQAAYTKKHKTKLHETKHAKKHLGGNKALVKKKVEEPAKEEATKEEPVVDAPKEEVKHEPKDKGKTVIVKASDTKKIEELKATGYKHTGYMQDPATKKEDKGTMIFEQVEPGDAKTEEVKPESVPAVKVAAPTPTETADVNDAEPEPVDDTEHPHPDAILPGAARPRSHKQFKHRKSVSIKSLATGAWNKKRQATKNVLRHHKQGFASLRKFLTGGEISPVEQERAKRTATLTAKLVIGALVGIAIFSPLGVLAAPVAAAFMHSGGGESADKDLPEAYDTEEFAMEFADKMHAWLIKQDIPALIEQLKKEKQ